MKFDILGVVLFSADLSVQEALLVPQATVARHASDGARGTYRLRLTPSLRGEPQVSTIGVQALMSD